MRWTLVMSFLALAGLGLTAHPQAEEDTEVRLDRLLSLLNDANGPDTGEGKRICEIVVQYAGESPKYTIAVIDANAVRTCLTFSEPDIEAMKAGKMDKHVPTGRAKLVLMHDGKTTLLDHEHRLHAVYPSLPSSAFRLPTRLWLKSFLSSYVGREAALTIRKQASAKVYEIVVQEMTRIDETLSGVLKVYLDTSSLALTRIRFIGRCKMDKDQDGEADIVRINLSFVDATTGSQPGEENKSQPATPGVSEYRQVEVR